MSFYVHFSQLVELVYIAIHFITQSTYSCRDNIVSSLEYQVLWGDTNGEVDHSRGDHWAHWAKIVEQRAIKNRVQYIHCR
jgi:hypothetical protein